jgi:hypothetical protein
LNLQEFALSIVTCLATIENVVYNVLNIIAIKKTVLVVFQKINAIVPIISVPMKRCANTVANDIVIRTSAVVIRGP